ncbi:MAG: 3-phosphoserine/phosphohydroxythreonine transaminase [Flavobacteriales bacterium]|jgi:phosphoserine aminotransferase|nr:3-phosphoserine/phosphohydroxythreonine transaminase [Flavobacteriales bacterium]|tara:strand:+ start:5068 stop:6150 length:1083 start_codon:yes stop_codon:yes gene_type:complete
MKKHNFSAGPSILNHNVIKAAAESVIDINNLGLSLLEISHRSNDFIKIIEEAKSLIKDLLNINEQYEVLFLQGGASLQFYMSALNFAKRNGKAGYIDTGTWSSKAIDESKKVGETLILASSKDQNYTYIPEINEKIDNIDYLHFTSNNTIYGTQFHSFENISKIALANNTKLICDMSSDILSKEFDVNKFDLIYAGAQKNIGPAGTTLVIIRKDGFEKNNKLPTYLNYQTHIEKQSMFNTPPVFPIYVCLLTLRWIKKLGGIKSIEKNNIKKANLIYDEIDRNSLFYGIVKQKDRSNMNVTFQLKNKKHEDTFNKMCHAVGISGIYGHRSIGGYRASIYNALKTESIYVLIDVMQKLEQK